MTFYSSALQINPEGTGTTKRDLNERYSSSSHHRNGSTEVKNRLSRLFRLALHLLALGASAQAQTSFSSQERLQGYVIAGDTAIFVFDASLYDVQPQRVLLEGEMRGWDHNMEDQAWHMQRLSHDPKLWRLAIANHAFAKTQING